MEKRCTMQLLAAVTADGLQCLANDRSEIIAYMSRVDRQEYDERELSPDEMAELRPESRQASICVEVFTAPDEAAEWTPYEIEFWIGHHPDDDEIFVEMIRLFYIYRSQR
jgi:hypothetical protein